MLATPWHRLSPPYEPALQMGWVIVGSKSWSASCKEVPSRMHSASVMPQRKSV
jgi:hypothetical protein